MKEKLKWGASTGDPAGPDSRSGERPCTCIEVAGRGGNASRLAWLMEIAALLALYPGDDGGGG
jgi:hypothetical protein